MSTITITLSIFTVLSLLLNFYFISLYTGKIQDKDKDMIADAAEEAVAEIKSRAENVVKEIKDVGDAIKEVGNQIGDIPSAATGKQRSGRKKQ